ncbi:hypothetical protein [Tianweitania sediminis]|uniref:Uncharacterized protein n=1 Tax=Tianweitania sediminis TaxID=1502156 RepID=A0A8J7UK99_9HYPH|nr:hypothetical protein [Tianweitania sediminis]MBP0439469.1 hypothetical protein [Tianweitania sediminis]
MDATLSTELRDLADIAKRRGAHQVAQRLQLMLELAVSLETELLAHRQLEAHRAGRRYLEQEAAKSLQVKEGGSNVVSLHSRRES